MGSKVTPGWWAVDLLSTLLERDERHAVCGDLVESHAPCGRALREVAGLVIRRQAALWLGWRPWVALATIVLPLGFLLSVSSRGFADSSALHVSVYTRTGEWRYFAVPGWRRDVIAAATASGVSFLALAAWSWTTGFVLGRVSRRASCTTAVLCGLIVVLGTLGSTATGRSQGAHFLPIGLFLTGVLRIFLVLLPAWRAFNRGLRPEALRVVPAIGIALAVVVLTALISKELEGSLILGWGATLPWRGPDDIGGTADDLRPLWWISLVMMWPVAYILTSAFRRGVRL